MILGKPAVFGILWGLLNVCIGRGRKQNKLIKSGLFGNADKEEEEGLKMKCWQM